MIEAGPVTDMPEGTYRVFETTGGRWIIAYSGGAFHAIRDRCGHLPQSMMGARLTGYQWQCPHHGVTYDIRTGEVVDDRGFVDIEPLEVAACHVQADHYLIEAEPAAAITERPERPPHDRWRLPE